MAGRSVDAEAVFPDGSEGAGFAGVRDYVLREREADFLDNVSRKLLAYALSRSLLLSDEFVIEKMQTADGEDGPTLGSLVEAVVLSPQFLSRRPPAEAGFESTAGE